MAVQSRRHPGRRIAPVALAAVLAAGSVPVIAHDIEEGRTNERPRGFTVLSTKVYRGGNDLLTAGLGANGLLTGAGTIDPTNPEDLRRLAIFSNYRAILDILPNGGYGRLYGPNVTADGVATTGDGKIEGIEVLAFADRNAEGGPNVTMMVQVPDSFDPKRPCIVTATSSGSRGVYGAIGSAGEWGLKRGCAVAYTDKGTGNGVHDLAADKVNLFNGVRTPAATAGGLANFRAPLTEAERIAFNADFPNRIAYKHAHSQRNPERDWGRDTLDAVRFAFYVLNDLHGDEARDDDGKPCRRIRITPRNTVVIASSVSNGAGAALAAAEQDVEGLIDGVAVAEPNIQVSPRRDPVIKRGSLTYTGGSRPLYDYFSYANLYQPCAALSTRAAASPQPFPAALASLPALRCGSLAAKGLLASTTLAAQAEEAMDKLLAYGWEPETIPLQVSHYRFATPSIVMTYANTYGRFSVKDNLCGFSFAATDAATGAPIAADPLLANIFGNGNGVPPSGGVVNIVNNLSPGGAVLDLLSKSPSTGLLDLNLDGALCQRALWTGHDANALRLKLGVAEVQRRADLNRKPAIIVHGRNDTLVPVNFNSRPYYARNQQVEGRHSRLRYIEVTNAQHFDAFLGFPGYDNTLVPLHVYFIGAMDAMWAHLTRGKPLPPSQVVRTTPRGGAAGAAPALTAANVPPIADHPPAGDRITFDGRTLTIPD